MTNDQLQTIVTNNQLQTNHDLFDATKFLDVLDVNFGRKLHADFRSSGEGEIDRFCAGFVPIGAFFSPDQEMCLQSACCIQEGAS